MPSCISWGDLVPPSLTSVGTGRGGLWSCSPIVRGRMRPAIAPLQLGELGGAWGLFIHPPSSWEGLVPAPSLQLWDLGLLSHSPPELLGLSSFLLPALGGLRRGGSLPPPAQGSERGWQGSPQFFSCNISCK